MSRNGGTLQHMEGEGRRIWISKSSQAGCVVRLRPAPGYKGPPQKQNKTNETTNKTFNLYAYNTACPYFCPIPTRKARILGTKIRIYKRREMNKEDETNLSLVLSFKSPFTFPCMRVMDFDNFHTITLFCWSCFPTHPRCYIFISILFYLGSIRAVCRCMDGDYVPERGQQFSLSVFLLDKNVGE